jgi:hypothetical protein
MESNFMTGIVRVMVALLVLVVMLSGVNLCQMAREHYVAEPARVKNLDTAVEKTNTLMVSHVI